jgi:hypothetical protein
MDFDPQLQASEGQHPKLSISHDAYWQQQASELPERVWLDDHEWQTDHLSSEARKLLAIYLADAKIVAQHKEILALAELGLVQIKQQFRRIASENGGSQ